MWPDADDTRTLLERVRRGDALAVNGLLERHRGALAQMAALRLDPAIARRLDASDVVQDVLLEAHQRLAGYLDAGAIPFHLWLRQLARDRIIDLHRRHRKAERRSVDREDHAAVMAVSGSTLDLVARLCDHEPTPATAALLREWTARYAAALAALEEMDREIIVMRHAEQLSNRDTALALGLSEPAAGMHYLRAIRRLRDRLAEASASGESR